MKKLQETAEMLNPFREGTRGHGEFQSCIHRLLTTAVGHQRDKDIKFVAGTGASRLANKMKQNIPLITDNLNS